MNKEKEFLNSAPAPKPPTKEDLQIKKLQLQIEQIEEKKRQQAQQQPTEKIHIFKGLGALALILLAPFIILGGFLLACAKASR